MKRKIIFAISFASFLFLVSGIIQVRTVFASYILGYNEDVGKFQNFNLDDNSTNNLIYADDSDPFSELESLTYGGGSTYYGIESFNRREPSTLYTFEQQFPLPVERPNISVS